MVKTMNKFLLILIFLPSICQASQIVYTTTYAPNSQVTNITLNGNNNAISNVVNGGLDNTNANTTLGYRFYQTVAVLPAAGNQGAVYFLTSDNSLNFDTGSVFNKSVTVNSPSNGDTIYYNSGWNARSIGAANTVLTSNGSIPSWSSSPTVPVGGIILWSGSIVSIPSNWQICDGTNGTPNLKDKFVIGAGNTYAVNATGGSTTITQANLPIYNLSVGSNISNSSAGSNNGVVQNQSNNGTVTISSGGSGTAYLQPYFAIAYIERMT